MNISDLFKSLPQELQVRILLSDKPTPKDLIFFNLDYPQLKSIFTNDTFWAQFFCQNKIPIIVQSGSDLYSWLGEFGRCQSALEVTNLFFSELDDCYGSIAWYFNTLAKPQTWKIFDHPISKYLIDLLNTNHIYRLLKFNNGNVEMKLSRQEKNFEILIKNNGLIKDFILSKKQSKILVYLSIYDGCMSSYRSANW